MCVPCYLPHHFHLASVEKAIGNHQPQVVSKIQTSHNVTNIPSRNNELDGNYQGTIKKKYQQNPTEHILSHSNLIYNNLKYFYFSWVLFTWVLKDTYKHRTSSYNGTIDACE